MSLAQDLWKATSTVNNIEEQIGDVLDRLFGAEGWTDFTTDHYDQSIEVFGVALSVTTGEALRDVFRAMGVKRVWLHEHASETRRAGERFLWLGEGVLTREFENSQG